MRYPPSAAPPGGEGCTYVVASSVAAHGSLTIGLRNVVGRSDKRPWLEYDRAAAAVLHTAGPAHEPGGCACGAHP